MTDLELARKRFKAISEGRYASKGISIEEAKQQMRAADPEIDLSEILKALHQQTDLQKAATSTLIETMTDPAVIHYWSPALIGLFQALIPAGKSTPTSKTDVQSE